MVDPSHVKPHSGFFLIAPEHPSTKGEGPPSSCVGGVILAPQGGWKALFFLDILQPGRFFS